MKNLIIVVVFIALDMGSEGCLDFGTSISLPKLAIIISRMHECVFERV